MVSVRLDLLMVSVSVGLDERSSVNVFKDHHQHLHFSIKIL